MNYYTPYNIITKYQYITYKNIGKQHHVEFKAKRNPVYKIIRRFRNLFNKNERRYKNFNTFSQWKDYFYKQVDFYNPINMEDFIYFLIRKQCKYENKCEIMNGIAIPIYAILFSISLCLFEIFKPKLIVDYVFLTIVLLVLLTILLFVFESFKVKASFYHDVKDILQNRNL